jgi:hypothetical protein
LSVSKEGPPQRDEGTAEEADPQRKRLKFVLTIILTINADGTSKTTTKATDEAPDQSVTVDSSEWNGLLAAGYWLAVSPIRPPSHLSSRTFYVSSGPAVHGPSTPATQPSVRESLREHWPGVWRVGVPIGLDPTTNRYWYQRRRCEEPSALRSGR